MIYEEGPEGPQTVPLTPFMREMWDAVYTDIAVWWDAGDAARLESLALGIPHWVSFSPFPNIVAHAVEYLWAAIDTVEPKPQPPPPEVVAVPLPTWGEGVAKVREEITNRPRRDNWLYDGPLYTCPLCRAETSTPLPKCKCGAELIKTN